MTCYLVFVFLRIHDLGWGFVLLVSLFIEFSIGSEVGILQFAMMRIIAGRIRNALNFMGLDYWDLSLRNGRFAFLSS